MASGGLSPILEVQCPPGQVPHANRANPKQSCLHDHGRPLQTRMLEPLQHAQSLRALSQATHQRIAYRLCPASAVQGCCVTSVTKNRLAAMTVIHNYDLRRADGTTAAQRLFGSPFPNLFDWLLGQMGELPLPRMSRQRIIHNPLKFNTVPL